MADQTLTMDEFRELQDDWLSRGEWGGAVLSAVAVSYEPGRTSVTVTTVAGSQERYTVLGEEASPPKPPVTKWTLTTDPLMVRRMGKTGEECSELVAVTARIGIQGIDEIDPGTGKTNRLRLIEEIGDVYAQLDANLEMLGLDREFIEARRARKLGYMREWEALYVTGGTLPQDGDGAIYARHPARMATVCDTSKPAEAQGLFRKFDVRRTDGSSAPGGRHADCEHFVIDVHHDAHAGAALAAYADAVESTHPALAADMRERYELERPCDAAEGRTFYADPAQLKMTQAAAMTVRRHPDAQHTVPLFTQALSGAARDVLAERQRQVTAEGWTPEHDDQHGGRELARAAACYAITDGDYTPGFKPPLAWPWAPRWFKPKNTRSNLVRAGALILAEIERLDRAAAKGTTA